MFQYQDSNIRNINVVEKNGGAVVEIVLSDALQIDDAEEYLSFSFRVEYPKNNPGIEEIKKAALICARATINHEITTIENKK